MYCGARNDLVSSFSKNQKTVMVMVRHNLKKEYWEIEKDLNHSCANVDSAFTRLVDHLKSENSNVRDDDMETSWPIARMTMEMLMSPQQH